MDASLNGMDFMLEHHIANDWKHIYNKCIYEACSDEFVLNKYIFNDTN